ncbi:HesA/MoeB/ThiF family protein [Litorilituus sediminis]|uniref:HesA/MoeB/ThiF family protein n=1 Tax=Litorilituus sediminis TaxID=718192 RepID=A0A4P6PAC7_9GAMM|nr:HesA/MoeB/ThiF family protein [Litorilituus sediminis]QBG36565.1 HesA/MoeB/ThiF family protein [Litorilituus sediminis]
MLTTQEQLKYSRQVMLNKIGEQGQLALRNAKVLILGVGGLGNPASLYLAAAGVGTLYLADGDNIEVSNLPRQILFNEQDIDSNKADTAAEKLSEQFPDTSIEAIDDMLDKELCDYYLPQVDLVLDCSDNIQTRYLINQACIEHKVPLVVGAATGFDGQQLTVDPRDETSACYHCLFPASEKAPANNCQTIGIIGPVLAMVAGMQALQAIKLLTGNNAQINQLNLLDGLANRWQQFTMKKQANCSVCGH